MMMMDAQNLSFTESAGSAVFSPWFPRGGDNLLLAAELIAGSGQISVTVYHKVAEDAGDGTAVGTAVTVSAPGRNHGVVTGLKDLVRLRMSASSVLDPPQAGWVIFRVLGMVWFDTVKG